MHTITFRHDINLLDIAWMGQFTRDSAADYAREVLHRFAAERFKPGYLLRMDMSASPVQSQVGASVIHEQLRGFPRASAIAIVTPSAITRMQVRRLMTQPYLQVFDTAEPALQWLLAGDSARTSPGISSGVAGTL
ncbi:STAS/SEC14 domain-containing protein [Sphingomonas sp. NY01]|uniref:STAS/SEC14 domain-containing protein n=1 Tax=Sphingomonas sp. NY01 TaxID=2968057 RepID=UPI00315D2BF0